jgi:hypothetical protein
MEDRKPPPGTTLPGDPTSIIEGLTQTSQRNPDTVTLWSAIEDEFGGAREFARMAKLCYDQCPEGGASQVRMMSLFLELHKQAALQTPDEDEVVDLSNEELARALGMVVTKDGIGQLLSSGGDPAIRGRSEAESRRAAAQG